MPVIAAGSKPVRAAVTVPGSADLEFSARSTGGAPADVVVLYTVMDGAAVRIADGASRTETVGTRATPISQNLTFGWTDNPTPGVFRVQAIVMVDGERQFEETWTLQVRSTATRDVMAAMNSLGEEATAEGFTPLPDEASTIFEEVEARNVAAKKKAAGKRAAAKKQAPAKKSAAKKGAAKKSATKTSAAKKSSAGKKSAAKRKTTATKAAPKKKTTAKKSSARKKSARR